MVLLLVICEPRLELVERMRVSWIFPGKGKVLELRSAEYPCREHR
jgi:hypothetical protein